jgi:ABC-type hemin transport system ATPase subunit
VSSEKLGRYLKAAAQPHTFEDGLDVMLDRARTNMKPPSDIAMRKVLGQQTSDLAFARRQRRAVRLTDMPCSGARRDLAAIVRSHEAARIVRMLVRWNLYSLSARDRRLHEATRVLAILELERSAIRR